MQINYLYDGHCWINFMDIVRVIKLIDDFNNFQSNSYFYKKHDNMYPRSTIVYGKDLCENIDNNSNFFKKIKYNYQITFLKSENQMKNTN